MSLLQEYKAHEAQRQSEGGLPGLALTAAQTADLVEILKSSKVEDAQYALNLFKNKINLNFNFTKVRHSYIKNRKKRYKNKKRYK